MKWNKSSSKSEITNENDWVCCELVYKIKSAS